MVVTNGTVSINGTRVTIFDFRSYENVPIFCEPTCLSVTPNVDVDNYIPTSSGVKLGNFVGLINRLVAEYIKCSNAYL